MLPPHDFLLHGFPSSSYLHFNPILPPWFLCFNHGITHRWFLASTLSRLPRVASFYLASLWLAHFLKLGASKHSLVMSPGFTRLLMFWISQLTLDFFCHILGSLFWSKNPSGFAQILAAFGCTSDLHSLWLLSLVLLLLIYLHQPPHCISLSWTIQLHRYSISESVRLWTGLWKEHALDVLSKCIDLLLPMPVYMRTWKELSISRDEAYGEFECTGASQSFWVQNWIYLFFAELVNGNFLDVFDGLPLVL